MSDEIAPAGRSGGTNTSHTIVVPALQTLLGQVGLYRSQEEYRHAVIEDNVLGKAAAGARARTFRYLRELYLLDPASILFRALCDLWTSDVSGQPLIAGLCALARDPSFRATAPAVLSAEPGDLLRNVDLVEALEEQFPDAYSEATAAKVGRNTFSSWEQTGHLEPAGRSEKRRVRPVATPGAAVFALFLGYLEGVRGEALFDTFWVEVLDHPRSYVIDLASIASQQMVIDFRSGGGVIEVGFAELLRPVEGTLK